MGSRIIAPGVDGDGARRPQFPVFFAFNFRDRRPERDYLVRYVLPDVRALCTERGVNFMEMVAPFAIGADATLGQREIGTCIEDIDRHRPLFIGIIGFDGEDAAGGGDEGHSLTEIELAEQALMNLTLTDRAVFYIRGTTAVDNASERGRRLKALMDRIRECDIPLRGPFASSEALGESLRQDLRAALDRIYPPRDETPLHEQQWNEHEAFAATRRRIYVDDPAMIALLDSHAADDGGPIVVTADAASRVSALLAQWGKRCRDGDAGPYVVEHYVGGTSARDHISLLRRIMAEIKGLYMLPVDLPPTAAEIESSATAWLARVQERPLIIIIDGLHDLDPESLDLAWLPEYIQPNVRLLVSTIGGPTLDELRARGWRELHIEPLTHIDRAAIMTRLLTSLRTPLDADAIEGLISETAGFDPESMEIVAQELAMKRVAMEVRGRIETYLNAREDLYHIVLADREEAFNADVVRDVMSVLWASRGGLTQNELADICAPHRAELPGLLRTLEISLNSTSTVLSFSNEKFRQAVELRYLVDEGRKVAAHRRLIEFFKRQAYSPRTIDELLHQYRTVDDRRAMLALIGRVDVLVALCRQGREYELLRHWLDVAGEGDMAAIYPEALKRFGAEQASPLARYEAYVGAARILHLANRLDAAGDILQDVLDDTDGDGIQDVEHRIRIINMLGLLYQSRGDFASAGARFRESRDLCSAHLSDDHPETVRTTHHLATHYYRDSTFDRAIELLEGAINLLRHSRADPRDLAGVLNDLSAAWYAIDNPSRAEACSREALRELDKVCTPRHPDRLEALNNLAAILMRSGKLEEAEEMFGRALDIGERAFGRDSVTIALYVNNRARAFNYLGRPEEARELYERALAIYRKNDRARHPETANVLINLASLYRALKEYDRAESMLDEAFAIRIERFGFDHIETAIAGLNRASYYKEVGELYLSLMLYLKYAYTVMREAGVDRGIVAGALRGFVELLDRMGWRQMADDIRRKHPDIFQSPDE